MSVKKIILINILAAGLLQAQFSKSLEISSSYDDNLFRAPEANKDILTDVLLNLEYQPNASNVNFKYSGNFFMYQDNAVRNFSVHELGLNYQIPFGNEDIHNLYLGADYTMRLNGDEYNYYDYNQIYAYANMRLDLDLLFLTTGYNYRNRSYSNLPELSNDQHYVFAQINKSFASRTTLIIETDLGYKSFAGERSYSTTMMSNDGHGRGGRNTTTTMTTATTNESIPGLSQAVVLTRISQSIYDNVGIYLQYRRQFSLTDETNFINADDYYQDEELFDDPFSFESESFSAQFTWMLPWSMKLRLGGTMISKEYISDQAFTSALDSVGAGGIRQDDGNSLFLNISKIWFLNQSWLESLHFNIHYNYIRSESNSYWYNYRNNIFGGGIQMTF